MMTFTLNGENRNFKGDPTITLLHYLREVEGIMSPKDGCSGQAACGACTIELNGKPALSCVTPMKKVQGKKIITIEGFPEILKRTLASAFVEKGAVQCGFCTPGFLMRTKILLGNNPNPTREQIVNALKINYCRCTGYIKIVEAIQQAAQALRENKEITLKETGKIGTNHPKYKAFEKALGQNPFVDDMKVDHMLHSALKFSDFPRAKVIKIDSSKAEKLPGVMKILPVKISPENGTTG